MAWLVTQRRRFPSTGGEVLEVFGSTPPTAFISLLLVPVGRVDSVTPVIQERWPCQGPDVADSSRLEGGSQGDWNPVNLWWGLDSCSS